MATIEFQPWPKIARLNREIIVTEKLDGTNAAIGIKPVSELDHWAAIVDGPNPRGVTLFEPDHSNAIIVNDEYAVYAQSRTRLITPTQDNYGFARWVWDHAEELATTLGYGLHFGEYWGSGINRGYGLQKGEKRFSLFNTPRYVVWGANDKQINVAGLKDIGVSVVPELYKGLFSEDAIKDCVSTLAAHGSEAAPGFMNPEGVVVFHTAAQTAYKVTIEGDEKPKGSKE